MNLYAIRNWNALFENNRTRELKKLDWVPIPNKQDGDGYTLIMERQNGPEIFGTWVAIIQVASRCDPRGTLLRDGGKPHDSASLSRMTRIPEPTIRTAMELLSHADINWLSVSKLETDKKIPADGCEIPADGCLEGKEGKEGREGKEPYYPEPAFPSWEQWWNYCQIIGLAAEWKAKDEWQKQEAKNWAGIQKWQAHAARVRTWWESDGRPMAAGSKKPKRGNVPNI